MKITNLVSAEFILDNWKPKILVFTRDENKNKILTEINTFKPFIYIKAEDKINILQEFERDIIDIIDDGKSYLHDKNKKLLKLILNNPLSIYKIKEKYHTYESDIHYLNKWAINDVEEIKTENLRINYLDIETTSKQGFPNYLNAIEEIISIGCSDNYLNKSFLWIWHTKYKNEVLERKVEEGMLEVRRFNTENDMLNNFLDFIVETKPDLVTSWHVAFDIPYLISRLDILRLDAHKLSPFYGTKYQSKFYKGLVEWYKGAGVYGKRFGVTQNEKHPEIKGLQYFDMLTAYKNIVAKEMESFKLDYVASVELGLNKLKTHFDIGAKWLEDPEFIENYNYIDVFLLQKLDEKMKILNRYITIRDRAFLININDVFSTGRILDSFILKKYKDSIIFPSKVYDESRDSSLAGGFVRDTIPKVYDNIAVFDFSGFYPSLMQTFNLSSEKLIKEEVLFKDTTVDENIDVKELLNYKSVWNEEKQEITYKIITKKYIANLTYKLDSEGVMSQAVKELITLRKDAKNEMKKYKYGSVEYNQWYNNQFSYKFIINGIYGASGYQGFRLFNVNNANAITGFARMLSKWVQYRLEEKGWKVESGDTDSLFTQLKTIDLKDNLNEIEKEIEPLIKKAIDEFVLKFLPEKFANKHTLKMDCEKIYSRLLLLDVKKRYIGMLKYFDGNEVNKLHMMGLDSKKSNVIEICKQAQLDLAQHVLENKDINQTMEKYYKIVKESKDLNLYKTPSKLEKPKEEYKVSSPAIRASDWSNTNLKTRFRAGTKFYILYVKKNKNCNTDIVAFEDIDQLKDLNIELDREKYLEDLYNKFNNLIRGIPEINKINEYYYNRFLKGNRSIFDFIPE